VTNESITSGPRAVLSDSSIKMSGEGGGGGRSWIRAIRPSAVVEIVFPDEGQPDGARLMNETFSNSYAVGELLPV